MIHLSVVFIFVILLFSIRVPKLRAFCYVLCLAGVGMAYYGFDENYRLNMRSYATQYEKDQIHAYYTAHYGDIPQYRQMVKNYEATLKAHNITKIVEVPMVDYDNDSRSHRMIWHRQASDINRLKTKERNEYYKQLRHTHPEMFDDKGALLPEYR